MRRQDKTGRAWRRARRGTAFAMAAVLCLSVSAAAPAAKAAGFAKPKLAVKKKTLYYNKKEKKTYTLKLKTNKAAIKKTTWKTSRKSVVAISKKKKTSVKLTAKKKGTATVSATVRYVPKGKWMVRTLKLKCKITSKKAGSGGNTSTTPGNTPKPVPKPTPPGKTNPPASKDPASKVSKVEIDRPELLFASTEEGENTETLTAVVTDSQGNELEDQAVSWISDNKTAAAVDKDGMVTAKKEGVAHITAMAGKVKSAPCTVIVDTTAPAVEGAVITDYKTITIYFDEPMEGTPEVEASVASPDSPAGLADLLEAEPVSFTPELSEDGKKLALLHDTPLPAAIYNLAVSGLTDHVGNELANGGKVSVMKENSQPKEFIFPVKEVPAGKSETAIRYAIVDQYGEEMPDVIGDLEAEAAAADSGMPLEADVQEQNRRIVLSGAVGMLPEGKKIRLTLSSESLGLRQEISVEVVSPEDFDKPAGIDRINVSSPAMESGGSSSEPEFTLSVRDTDNVFNLSSEVSNKFGSSVESKVVYVINETKDNRDVVEFIDTGESGSKKTCIADSGTAVRVKARKGGRVTITAYLASDDSLRKDITVVIHATELERITVGELASGYNRQAGEAKVSLSPAGTGITAKDLRCKILQGEERIEDPERDVYCFDDSITGEIYVSIKTKNDGLDTPVKFRLYHEESGIESSVVTYESSPIPVVDAIQIEPFGDRQVPVQEQISTTYQLLNRYGEDITAIAGGSLVAEPAAGSSKTTVSNVQAAGGKLSLTGVKEGRATIILTYNNITASVNVGVTAKARVNKVIFSEKTAELIIGRAGQYADIPVSFENQHGGEMELTLADITKELDCLYNGAAMPASPKLKLTYLAADGNGGYQLLDPDVLEDNGKVVKAIRLELRNSLTNADAGTVRISFGSKKEYEGFESGQLSILIQEKSKLHSLSFEKQTIISATGSEVVNTVIPKDQYGEEWALTGSEKLEFLVEKDNVTVGSGSVSGGKTKIAYTPTEDGVYIVTAYVGNDLESASVKASYTLTAGSAEEMVDSLSIDSEIKSGDSSHNVKEVDYIRFDEGSEGSILKLNLKAYDVSGKEILLNDTSIDTDQLNWSASGEGVGVLVPDKGYGKIKVMKSGSSTTGTVTVDLDWTKKNIHASIDIPVSCQAPKAKAGTYKIVQREQPEEDITNTTLPVSGSSFCQVKATDQYGDSMSYTDVFYSIFSMDTSVADVTQTKDGGIVVWGNSETEKTTQIKVNVTKEEILTFTVKARKAFQQTDVTTQWKTKAKGFASEYYNKRGDGDVISVKPEKMDICYFAIPFEMPARNSGAAQTTPQVERVLYDEEPLSSDSIKVSIGKNAFLELPDYEFKDNKLLISYVFAALHNTNAANKMVFEVEFDNGSTYAAVLKVRDIQEGLFCNGVKAAAGNAATVEIAAPAVQGDKVEKCELVMKEGSKSGWNHMILLSFSQPSEYYFTRKVVDGKISYGFTEPDGDKGELGYYPYRYSDGNTERTMQYTVAAADRHGAAEIEIHQSDDKVQAGGINE